MSEKQIQLCMHRNTAFHLTAALESQYDTLDQPVPWVQLGLPGSFLKLTSATPELTVQHTAGGHPALEPIRARLGTRTAVL